MLAISATREDVCWLLIATSGTAAASHVDGAIDVLMQMLTYALYLTTYSEDWLFTVHTFFCWSTNTYSFGIVRIEETGFWA